MKALATTLLLLGYTTMAADSSLSPLYGDRNIAPIRDSESQEVPGDKVVPRLDVQTIDVLVEQAHAAWKTEQEKIVAEQEQQEKVQTATPPPSTVKPLDQPVVAEACPTEATPLPRPVQRKKPRRIVLPQPQGRSITIFPEHVTREEDTITLPSGAHAFGRIKFGDEVAAGGGQEVLLELDYAFLGPNDSVVEMTGCVAWLQISANFNTQRVVGSLQDMTCTSPRGRVFTIPLNGPIVGISHGYAGVDSELIMRGPAKAAALKFLSEITSAYGAATAATETTTRLLSAGEGQLDKSTNVTGSKGAYTGGKILEANGRFLDYISSFFSSMQPTLALAPGSKVHVVNRYNIQVPKIFFKEKESPDATARDHARSRRKP